MHHNMDNILEYAKLSKQTYAEKKEDEYLGSDELKFYAEVFERKGEVVIAFRGTKFSDGNDLQNDLQIFLRRMPSRVNLAIKYVEDVQEHYNKKRGTLFCCSPPRIKIVGHSLGGAIAQWLSMERGLEAYTFDSPGCLTSIDELKSTSKRKGRCYNFLSTPNLINTYNRHYDQIFFVQAGTDSSSLLEGIADSAETIAQMSTDVSFDSESSASSFRNSPYLRSGAKQAVQYVAKKTVEHFTGKTLINHTLNTHRIDFIIENLQKVYVEIHPMQSWPKFEELIKVIGGDPSIHTPDLEKILCSFALKLKMPELATTRSSCIIS